MVPDPERPPASNLRADIDAPSLPSAPGGRYKSLRQIPRERQSTPGPGRPTAPSRPCESPGLHLPAGPTPFRWVSIPPSQLGLVPFYLIAENVWKRRGSNGLPGTGPPRIPTRNKCTSMMWKEPDQRQRQLHPDPIEGSMLAPARTPTTPARRGADWRKEASISLQAVIGGNLFRASTMIGESRLWPAPSHPVLGGAEPEAAMVSARLRGWALR